MDINQLKEVGLTPGEIRVYRALLELGEGTKTPIATRSNISPSKVYDVLHRLQEKGIVTVIRRGSVQRFRPVDPKRLFDYLAEKQERLNHERQTLAQMMPALQAMYEEGADDTDAEVFRGWEGMEAVYRQLRDSLKPGDLNYCFGASKGADPERTRLFFTRHNSLQVEKKTKLKIIFNEAARGNIPVLYEHPDIFEVRHVSQATPAEINIWHNNVMIVILSKIPTVVLIRNEMAATSFREYFQVIWASARP